MLNAIEAAYLASILGADFIIGIGDPFYGMLRTDIDRALLDAQKSLIKKGFIRIVDGQILEIDICIIGLINTMIMPQLNVLVFRNDKEVKDREIVFHFKKGMCLMHSLPKEYKEEIAFELIDSKELAINKIANQIPFLGYKNGEEINLQFNKRKLWENYNRGRTEYIEDNLENNGSNYISQENIIGNILRNEEYFSVMALRLLNNEWIIKCYIYKLFKNKLWKIEIDFDHKIENAKIVSTSSSKTVKEIIEMIENLISVS